MTQRPGNDGSTWRTSHVALGLMALGLAAGFFATFGWIGLGLLGLAGLMIVQGVDLYGDNAAAQFPGSLAARYAVRERERRARLTPEEKLAESVRHDDAQRIFYVVNTICLSLTALGFSMFVLHQL